MISTVGMSPYVAQSLAAFVACLGMIDIGIVVGWPSPSLPKFLPAQGNETRDENELLLTSEESSWVVSISFFAAILSPLTLTYLLDGFGRKLSLLAMVIPLLVSWIFIAAANNVTMLYIGRFFAGISFGLAFPIQSTYAGEIANEKIRGFIGMMVSISLLVGCLFAFCAGPWISTRTFAILSTVPLIIFLLTFFWIPETPYFWLMKGNRSKAKSSLMWLRRRDDVEEELAIIETSVLKDMENRENFSLGLLFRTPYYRKAMFISLGLLTFQQFTGGAAILSYAGLIFENSGLKDWNNYSLMLLGVVQVLSSIIGGFIIDLTGRRKILMISSLFTAFFMIVEAVFFHLKYLKYETDDFSWIPLVALLGFNLSITPGLFCTPWIVVTELFPTDVKAFASMLIGMYGSVGGFTVNKIYEPIDTNFGVHWNYYLFTCFLLASIPFVYFFLPETKQMSLEDIQKKLNPKHDSIETNLHFDVRAEK